MKPGLWPVLATSVLLTIYSCRFWRQSRAEQQARQAAGVAQQQKLAANALVFQRQIPEFASGGIVPGTDRGFDSVRALLRPGEMVLNMQQQARIASRAGSDVFQAAGVPGVNRSGRFDTGGIAPSGGFEQPIEISLDAVVVISDKTAEGLFVRGGRTSTGRAVVVNNVKVANRNREL